MSFSDDAVLRGDGPLLTYCEDPDEPLGEPMKPCNLFVLPGTFDDDPDSRTSMWLCQDHEP